MNLLQRWKLKRLLKTMDAEYVEQLEKLLSFWKEETYYWHNKYYEELRKQNETSTDTSK